MPTLLAFGFLSFVGIGLAFVTYVLWPRWPAPVAAPGAPSIPITIGNAAFNVPPQAFRVASQRRSGRQERVDLAFRWSAARTSEHSAKSAAQANAATVIDGRFYLTITRSDGTLPPAERVKRLYPRFIAGTPSLRSNGLVLLGFRDDTPYQGEDLFYDAAADAAAPDGFVVRCTRKHAAEMRGTCLYERRRAEADLIVRFPRRWLEDWRAVAGAIDRLIDSLARAPR
jgi:hypothetical protein